MRSKWYDLHTYNSFVFQSYLSIGTYLCLCTRNIEDANIQELILGCTNLCTKYPEDWVSLLYLKDISKRFELSRRTGTFSHGFFPVQPSCVGSIDIIRAQYWQWYRDYMSQHKPRAEYYVEYWRWKIWTQDVNTSQNLSKIHFFLITFHISSRTSYFWLTVPSLERYELKTALAILAQEISRSEHRFEYTSKENSENEKRKWTSRMSIMNDVANRRHLGIHFGINFGIRRYLLRISITSDTESNRLKSDVPSRGSVKIQSQVVTAES